MLRFSGGSGAHRLAGRSAGDSEWLCWPSSADSGMSGTGGKDDDNKKIEVFNWSDPPVYKRWRRRAELHLRALPLTFSKERWGPKLLEYVQGEAQELFEDASIEMLTEEDGYLLVFQMLDEKQYKELKQDELHKSLREYFYGTDIKVGQSYRNFMVRLDTAHRRLTQHGITLPEEVQGWFVLRKLRMEANSEAMVLTSTGGSLKVGDISRALQAVFPNGKGLTSKKDQDVYVAELTGRGGRHQQVRFTGADGWKCAGKVHLDLHQERGRGGEHQRDDGVTEYEVHTVHPETKKESEKKKKKKKKAEDWEVHRAELQVWRIHERPRRGMFVPTDAPDCPVRLDGKLEGYHDVINRSNAKP